MSPTRTRRCRTLCMHFKLPNVQEKNFPSTTGCISPHSSTISEKSWRFMVSAYILSLCCVRPILGLFSTLLLFCRWTAVGCCRWHVRWWVFLSSDFCTVHWSVHWPHTISTPTYNIVGCEWGKSIVYREESFIGNPDGGNPKYNTKCGMYKPNIGLENLMMSWGHDEYMYRVLIHNKSTLPMHALNIIRFHSFYPWHNGGDYEHLMKSEDEITKKWVLTFKWVGSSF